MLADWYNLTVGNLDSVVGAGNMSSRAEGSAVMMRRCSFSDWVLCIAPVSNKAKNSWGLQCKGMCSFLSFMLSRSLAVRGRTSVVDELVFRRGVSFQFAQLSLRVLCGGATSEAFVAASEPVTGPSVCLASTWGHQVRFYSSLWWSVSCCRRSESLCAFRSSTGFFRRLLASIGYTDFSFGFFDFFVFFCFWGTITIYIRSSERTFVSFLLWMAWRI